MQSDAVVFQEDTSYSTAVTLLISRGINRDWQLLFTHLFVIAQRHEICSYETRGSRLSYDVNPESLSHLGLNRYRVVTDGQTNRITIANTGLAVSAVARKNRKQFI